MADSDFHPKYHTERRSYPQLLLRIMYIMLN